MGRPGGRLGVAAGVGREHGVQAGSLPSRCCGRPVIWTGLASDVPEGDLAIHDLLGGLEPIDGQAVEIIEAVVREVFDTGLFSARGAEPLGFAHQTCGEFLAAWYVHSRGVDVARMLSLITHPGGEVIVPRTVARQTVPGYIHGPGNRPANDLDDSPCIAP